MGFWVQGFRTPEFRFYKFFCFIGLAFFVSGLGVWAFRGTGLRAKSLGCGVNGASGRPCGGRGMDLSVLQSWEIDR